MSKAIVNPVTGRVIHEYTYIFPAEDVASGKESCVFYIFVTDEGTAPTLWGKESDGVRNARPDLADEFIQNGGQWYDFNGYCPSRLNSGIVKVYPSNDKEPEGLKIRRDRYRK